MFAQLEEWQIHLQRKAGIWGSYVQKEVCPPLEETLLLCCSAPSLR